MAKKKNDTGLEITSVDVYPYKTKKGEKTSLKAFASITFNEAFVINNIRLMEGQKGLFISMPAQQDKNGDFHDVAFPIVSDLRAEITRAIVEEFDGK